MVPFGLYATWSTPVLAGSVKAADDPDGAADPVAFPPAAAEAGVPAGADAAGPAEHAEVASAAARSAPANVTAR